MSEMPILTQRRIEAAFAKGVYDEMKAELGEETAQRILSNAVIKLAKQAAAEMAKQAPDGKANLDSFRAIQPRWTAEDALRIDVVKSTASEFHFNVTRCRYAEMYRAMGLADFGALLSCNRDGAFCEGYDSQLKLQRTQTLMGGATHCDFRYQWSTDAE
jgi:L-2-amino-thiazoline-4-carboxylic acid hydrolase